MSSPSAADAAAIRRAKILAKSSERMSLVKGEITPTITETLIKKESVSKGERLVIDQADIHKDINENNHTMKAVPEDITSISKDDDKCSSTTKINEKEQNVKEQNMDIKENTDGIRRRGNAGEVVRLSERALETKETPLSPTLTNPIDQAIKSSVKSNGGSGGVLSEAARILRRQKQIDSIEAVLLAGFPVVLGLVCATTWTSCGLLSQSSNFLTRSESEDDTRSMASRKLFGEESMIMMNSDEGHFALDDDSDTEIDTTSLQALSFISSSSILLNTDSYLYLICSNISKRAPYNAPVALISLCLGRFLIPSLMSLLRSIFATATNSKAKDVLSTVQAEQGGGAQAMGGMMGLLSGVLKYSNAAMKWYRYGKSILVDVSLLVVSWIIIASILSFTQ
jgi:hypothetical protein